MSDARRVWRDRVAVAPLVTWLWLVLPAVTLFHLPSERWFQSIFHVRGLVLDTSELVLACFALACLLAASRSWLRAAWASGFMYPWVFYIACLLLSTIFAFNRQLAFIQDVQVVAGVALALTVWMTIDSHDRLGRALAVITLGGVMITIALTAIVAYASTTRPFPCPDGGVCLGGGLDIRAVLINGRLFPRAEIPGVDYNRTGLELVMATVAAGYLALTGRGVGRHLATIAVLVLFCGVVLTLSKGALLSLGVAVVLFELLGWLRDWRKLAIAAAATAVVLLVSGYMLALALRALSILSFIPALNRFLVAHGTLDTSDRIAMTVSTWSFFKRRPLFGIGPLNLQGIETVNGARSAEHNDYLRALAETGVIGFLALVLVVTAPFAALVSTLTGAEKRLQAPDRRAGQVLLVGMSALLVNFLVAPVDYSFWVWAGLICGWTMRVAPDFRLGAIPAELRRARAALPSALNRGVSSSR